MMMSPRRFLLLGPAAIGSALLLAGCGQRADLAYAVGAPGPAVPAGEAHANAARAYDAFHTGPA